MNTIFEQLENERYKLLPIISDSIMVGYAIFDKQQQKTVYRLKQKPSKKSFNAVKEKFISLI